MSQSVRTHRIGNIQEAIRTSVWLTIDLLTLASDHVDDPDTLEAIERACGLAFDQLSMISKADFSAVPF